MLIRAEQAADAPAIAQVVTAAFASAPHSSGSEAAIIAGLRAAEAVTLSLVAEDEALIGYVAFSPVTIGGRERGWFGLGPLAVTPSRQGEGVGGRLVRSGLTKLAAGGAAGCVVLGDPAYRRFGFVPDPALRYSPASANDFMRLVFAEAVPTGVERYHKAFDD